MAEDDDHILVEVEDNQFAGLYVAREPIVEHQVGQVLELTDCEVGLLLRFAHLAPLAQRHQPYADVTGLDHRGIVEPVTNGHNFKLDKFLRLYANQSFLLRRQSSEDNSFSFGCQLKKVGLRFLFHKYEGECFAVNRY